MIYPSSFYYAPININHPLKLGNFSVNHSDQVSDTASSHDANEASQESLTVELSLNTKAQTFTQSGTGVLDAFVSGLANALNIELNIKNYEEISIGQTSDTQALSIVQLESSLFKKPIYGVGLSKSTTKAALESIVCAMNRGIQLYQIDI